MGKRKRQTRLFLAVRATVDALWRTPAPRRPTAFAGPLENRILFSTPGIAGAGEALSNQGYDINLNANGVSVDHWSVNWSDGSTDSSDTGETASHTFATSGEFNVTAEAEDGGGDVIATSTLSLTVFSVPSGMDGTLTSSGLQLSVAPVSDEGTPQYSMLDADPELASDGTLEPFNAEYPTGLTPTQMQQAYGVNSITLDGGVTGDGSGQTIAIVIPYNDPDIASDLHNFDQYFSLPDPPSLTILNEEGEASPVPTDSTKNTYGPEESLDVEWAHVIAPQASITIFQTFSNSQYSVLEPGIVTAADYPGVSVVSTSIGFPEGDFEAFDTEYYGHLNSGVTLVAPTGDAGNPGVYPAESPLFLAVGGTTLTGSSGDFSETADPSGGGGIGSYENQPAYQIGTVTQSSTKRTIPDVAMDATGGVPIYDSYDYGTMEPWQEMMGTSLSAPMWAGLVAIADEGRTKNAIPLPAFSVEDVQSALYSVPYASDFNDIRTGSNGTYSAGVGYDLATGLGTPIAQDLVPELSNWAVYDATSNVTVSVVNSSTYEIGTVSYSQTDTGLTIDAGTNTVTVTIDQTDGNLTVPVNIQGSGACTLIVKNGSMTFGSNVGKSAPNLAFEAIDGAAVTFSASQTISSLLIDSTSSVTTSQPIATAVNDGGSLIFNSSGNVTQSFGISGSGSLVQEGGGTLVLAGANTYTGGSTVSAGALIISTTNALPSSGTVDLFTTNSALGIRAGSSSSPVVIPVVIGSGTLSVGTTSTSAYARLAQTLGSGVGSTVGFLTINVGSTLDVTDGSILIHYGGNADPRTTVVAELASGFNGGARTGTSSSGGVITSTTAAGSLSDDPTLSVGYADSATDGSDSSPTPGLGNASANNVLIRCVSPGDANMDGRVNFTDYSVLIANFGHTLTDWSRGNFAYGTGTNFTDYSKLIANFGTSNPVDPWTDYNTSDGGDDDAGLAVSVLSDGDIVIAGSTADGYLIVLELNSDGTVNSSFGIDGVVITEIGASAQGNAVQQLSNGDILVAGIGTDPTDSDQDIALVEYTSTGTLVSSFGTGGIALSDVGGSGDSSTAFTLTVLSNNNILVGGGDNNGIFLEEFNPDGTLDTSFGTGGIVSDLSLGDTLASFSLTVLSSGNILAAGGDQATEGVLIEFNADGSLDTSFGSGGVVVNSAPYAWQSVTELSSGDILVVGAGGGDGGDFVLAEYTSGGSLDSSFGSGGLTTFDAANAYLAEAIYVTSSNEIVIGGFTAGPLSTVVVVEFQADGQVDTSYGDDGSYIIGVSDEDPYAMTILPTSGWLVVTGWASGHGLYTECYEQIFA